MAGFELWKSAGFKYQNKDGSADKRLSENPELSRYISFMECLSHIEKKEKVGDKEVTTQSICHTKFTATRVPTENPTKSDAVEKITKI